MSVCKFLDASTHHVTEADAQILRDAEHSDQPIRAPDGGFQVVDPYQYGWWVHVQPDDATEQTEVMQGIGFSKAFVKLIDYARGLDCQWVRLDQDGYEIDDLERFDW